jgi:leader peptidase (prepilin peptidase) / N-methyltransferase
MLMALIGEWIFKKEAMGMGDVKLLGAIGAFFGAKAVLFNLVISSLFGSVVGITMVACGCKKMQSKIPYGPYIALAALIWMFWGENIWSAYINFLMPPLH